MTTTKALIGRDRICQYLRIGRTVFQKLQEQGLPAQKREGVWAAHADELDDWFRCENGQNSKV